MTTTTELPAVRTPTAPEDRRAEPRRVTREDAASRITAYVYGNVVVLSTLVPLGQEEAESGRAALIVLGVAFATFLAHALAESAGRRVRGDERLTTRVLLAEVRDSVPVLTSGLIPALVLGLAWWVGAPGYQAQLVAEAYVVLRLAATGITIGRLRGAAPSLRTLVAGLGLATVGAGLSVVKVAASV